MPIRRFQKNRQITRQWKNFRYVMKEFVRVCYSNNSAVVTS